MAVEEQQAEAAAAAEGEGDAEQDGAVAAEHDRERAMVEHRTDGVGQPGRVVAQAVGVEQPGPGIDLGVEGGCGQPLRGSGAEPLGQPGVEQRPGERLDPRGA